MYNTDLLRIGYARHRQRVQQAAALRAEEADGSTEGLRRLERESDGIRICVRRLSNRCLGEKERFVAISSSQSLLTDGTAPFRLVDDAIGFIPGPATFRALSDVSRHCIPLSLPWLQLP